MANIFSKKKQCMYQMSQKVYKVNQPLLKIVDFNQKYTTIFKFYTT